MSGFNWGQGRIEFGAFVRQLEGEGGEDVVKVPAVPKIM